MNHRLTLPIPRRRFFKSGLASAFGLGLAARFGRASEEASPAPAAAPAPPAPASAAPGGARRGLSASGSLERFGVQFDQIRREASDEELYRLLYAMPKGGDIHHHMAGGFLAERWFALASDRRRNGRQEFYTRVRLSRNSSANALTRRAGPHIFFWMTIRQSAYDELDAEAKREFKPMSDLSEEERAAWISSIKLDRDVEGRDEFFEYTWSRLNHLFSSIHVCSELVVENMRLMGAEGVRYLELMSGYEGWRDERGRLLPPEEADRFWRDRLARPDAAATGVTVKFKAMILRFAEDALDQARRHAAYVSGNSDLWVGIDMAGREDDNRGHPERFTETFDDLLREYPELNISIHAGESEKRDTHIFDTLRLGARRIGHGINLFRDPQTMQLMRGGPFLVEINLISNQLLDYVPELARHPFPLYLRQGIACCLNTDDRGMWDSNATDEWFVAIKRFNLSWREIVQLGRASLERSFLPPDERRRLIAELESELAAFVTAFGLPDWRAALARVPAETYGFGARHLGLDRLRRAVPFSGSL